MALQRRLVAPAMPPARAPRLGPRFWAAAVACRAGRRELPANAGGRQIVEFALWSAWEDMKNPKPRGKEVLHLGPRA